LRSSRLHAARDACGPFVLVPTSTASRRCKRRELTQAWAASSSNAYDLVGSVRLCSQPQVVQAHTDYSLMGPGTARKATASRKDAGIGLVFNRVEGSL